MERVKPGSAAAVTARGVGKLSEALRLWQRERAKQKEKSDRINDWTKKASTDMHITEGGKFSQDSALT